MNVRLTGSRLLAAAAMVVLGGGLAGTAVTAPAASASSTTSRTPVNVSVFSPPIAVVGRVNLTQAAQAQALNSRTAAPTGRYRAADNSIRAHAPTGKPTVEPNPATTALSTQNVKGEQGFSAIGGVQQANTTGGLDLEPPDQGLCAGAGYIMEFVNNALAIYDANGDQVLRPIGSPNAFLQPTTDFFSDPRCYFDAATQHWFYQEFIVGTVNASGGEASPSVQYLAVSDTADPTGSYTVFSWDTTDPSTAGCPCFGDYDTLGADNNGIYIGTDEFGVASGAYNGAIIYAVSKEELESYAASGIAPVVFGYRLTQDSFGQPYIVAPTTTPAGATFAPNTEYFVESNGNAATGNYLLVYALNDTSSLATPAAPLLYRARVNTETYSLPPDAAQRPGSRPLGRAVQDPEGGIQTDFDAEMEPTFVGGHVYGELDTGTASGTSAVDWFVLTPSLTSSGLAVTRAAQGTVAVPSTSLLYPYTALDKSGNGYLLFSLSGTGNYPSPAYIQYGPTGPTGPVRIATPGSAPEDGFTCYSAYVGPNYGGCRWGDYSMGVAVGSRIFMATEFVPQGYRDTLTNWGTYIWSAPAQ